MSTSTEKQIKEAFDVQTESPGPGSPCGFCDAKALCDASEEIDSKYNPYFRVCHDGIYLTRKKKDE